ncbi:hypothetical protein [Microlunatus parietis]|uniref:Uncharacterized protein n=1 Tax=Microlunatus parietis TaxID=682979 RepID=A0A7Y9I729_9ACTN|nr:hypothetical protein [Microlunatus parietis]NYE71352.1 hypothetical protein [Microlunatus parietis]
MTGVKRLDRHRQLVRAGEPAPECQGGLAGGDRYDWSQFLGPDEGVNFGLVDLIDAVEHIGDLRALLRREGHGGPNHLGCGHGPNFYSRERRGSERKGSA